MQYVWESVMLAVLLLILVWATVTDVKKSIVPNRLIIAGLACAVMLNTIYYVCWTTAYVTSFLINLAVIAVLATAFYASHIWAAGDSKLLFLAVSLIPARLYGGVAYTASSTLIVMWIFSIAFLWFVGESIWLRFREPTPPPRGRLRVQLGTMLWQYVRCFSVVVIANAILRAVFSSFYDANTALFMIGNMLLIMAVSHLSFFENRGVTAVFASIACGIVVCQQARFDTLNLVLYAFAAVTILLRFMSERYNYMVIPTSQVKAGMVLSLATVALFLPSRVKGLPVSTTEDVRSRITQEEAANIRRWETSKYGKSTVIIVRKIPFAIFIAVGTTVYIMIRIVCLKCGI